MTASNFLGIPHTGHDKTDGWVHKGEHWLEHSADEVADTLDEGAGEIVDTAVAAVHAALSTIGTDALKSLLHSLLGLARACCAQPELRNSDHPLYGVYAGHRTVHQHPRQPGHDPQVGGPSSARPARVPGDAARTGRRRIRHRAPA